MPNSYEGHLQGLYHAVLMDYVRQQPAYHREAIRDMSRIHSLVERHGLAFFTLALPAAGKHFDQCLSRGHLTTFKVLGFRPFKSRTTIPNLFKGMWLRVFDLNGVLRESPDIGAITMLRQLLNGAKKLRITCDEYRTKTTVTDFFRLDESLRLPSLDWVGDRVDFSSARGLHLYDGRTHSRESDLFPDDESGNGDVSSELLEAIQLTADIVSASLGRFDPTQWRARHGPGAVADAKLGKSFKYLFPTWPAKLDRIFPMDAFAFANASHMVDYFSNPVGTHSSNEPPSRLICVPKTQKGPRLIAAEPTAHQWAQQTIKDFLSRKVAKTPIGASISFRDQTPNQDFARSASRSGSHWTIDLSSASDCVSCWLVERIFRRNESLLEALHASRTRWLVNEITSEPKYHKIRKFAAMGAATTFPVQTYIYTIVCCAVLNFLEGRRPSIKNIKIASKQVRVFGDDIVVPDTAGASVVQVLTYLGFRTNPAKTFGTGKFRESCGVECFDGSDVTPAYILDVYDKSRPTTLSTVVDTHNNFYSKKLYAAAQWMKSTIPGRILQEIPEVLKVSGQFGFHSAIADPKSRLQRRWNEGLQRYEYRVFEVITRMRRIESNTSASLLQYFAEEPCPLTNWSSGYDLRPTPVVGRRWVPEVNFLS